jgi:CDP-glucose 4,6-dehydratase
MTAGVGGVSPEFWAGRRVLVTGHTGFKGAWAALWLMAMGAEVSGLALAPETEPSLFGLAGLAGRMRSVTADITDIAALDRLMAEARPEVVLHMAAQALVRRSYQDPVGTFQANVTGTVALLHAITRCPDVKAVVVVTSDKAYENFEWSWGYRESDPIGGRDPYSASKGAAEIATAAMRRSYFRPSAAEGHPARIATARAGNVIGGGDWAQDRLIPDIVRDCLGPAGAVTIRAPRAVRPWQHVLEPLRGYFMLAEALSADRPDAAAAWNFGPDRQDERPVIEVAEAVVAALGTGSIVRAPEPPKLHEAHLLTLDNSKARAGLGWRPALSFADTVAMTADWYSQWARGGDARSLTLAQIAAYRHRTET